MNTDKIYAEQLANEYALKDTSKVEALRKPDAKAKRPANIFTYTFGVIGMAGMGVNYPIYKSCWPTASKSMPLRSWSWPKRSAGSKLDICRSK